MSTQVGQVAFWSHPTIYAPTPIDEMIDPLDSAVPSAVHSPDSSYSATSPSEEFRSPTFPTDHAFEFDHSHEEIQAEEYDEMQEREQEEEEEPRWLGRRPSWALSAGGSVISVSPRGSLCGSLDSRRGSSISLSMSLTKAPRLPFEARRQSNPSLLGFDLAEQRRRSSAKSAGAQSLTRRRSSALSSTLWRSRRNSSMVDAMEEARLRNIASLDLLRRRFSEVVEVTHGYSDEEEDLDGAWDYQAWSSCTSDYNSEYDEDEDDSEVHTESYIPSPDSRNGASFVPSLFSNYPLESVARAPPNAPEENQLDPLSVSPSPLLHATRFPQDDITIQGIGTPPPSAQPNALLRDRSRPLLNRSITTYVAPRTIGVPPGAAPPRPGLARSVSNPLISSTASSQEQIKGLEIRASGSFPLARATPLGISPLRESLRRQSVISDGGESSRRSSLGERRRSSLVPGMGRKSTRSGSFNGSSSDINDASRRASLAERRMSLVKESAFRRMSGSTSTRKSSEADGAEPSTRRKNSRPSTGTRASSVVSIGEYGYLAPQIIIDGPKVTPKVSSEIDAPPKLRANAPPSIVLPTYTFPNTTLISPNAETPRFNPPSHFLRNPDPSPTSTPTYDPMITPTTSKSFFSESSGSGSLGSPKTPRGPLIDRGRPIPSPEYEAAKVLPFKDIITQPTSPKAEKEISTIRINESRIARKTLSIEDMHLVLEDTTPNGSIGEIGEMNKPKPTIKRLLTDPDANPNPQAGVGGGSGRPGMFRGLSFPISIKQEYTFPSPSSSSTSPATAAANGKGKGKAGLYTFPSSPQSSKSPKPKDQEQGKQIDESRPSLTKRRSITFIEPPSPRSTPTSSRPKLGERTSSFTRFFHSKSKK
ncbi:hypothetical protein I302_106625 [Kwoniella bestiolae CBS 10118]|uniref:Uncharacterized protein n=1 Tax=Kwoniella bestiolae CBS 10118 TaxID=1296100 RepID=A0A1B9G0V3_9TREE|nr:hypothetical protein I302_06113 [Kwoniella bestiolae CBS 10118]OCF24652.1 hypothetical protein I302_06113 [Kwoniella bestiolae CBS 10118]